MVTAFIFPGQGSQIIGMAKDFYNSFTTAKDVFELVDDTLGKKLSNIIFNGTEDELTITSNAQPALMAASMSILRVLQEQTNKEISELCSYVAGHSLGEYSALCAAGSLTMEDAAKLLHVRGASMQEACTLHEGAMAACIGIELNLLEEIIASTVTEDVCAIANDNVSGQLVISGHVINIEKVIATLQNMGFKAIKLKVGGAFHSNLMLSAEKKLAIKLEKIIIKAPKVPVIANITAAIELEPIKIKENLIKQICGRVRWREIMDKFAELGVTDLVEIGPKKVLSGLANKTPHNFKITSISNITEMEKYLES